MPAPAPAHCQDFPRDEYDRGQCAHEPARRAVFPAVSGGEQTLRELVHEFKTKGPVYRRTVQTTLRASYTGHYRRGLIALLDVLEFRRSNTAHRPVIDALTLIRRYAKTANLTYYPLGETVPAYRGAIGDWSDLVYRTDTRGRARVARMVYEVVTFQALREQLRCKEIWVVGADSWRNPDEDLPKTRLTITDRASGAITLTKYETAPEPRNLRRVKAEGPGDLPDRYPPPII